MDRVSGSAAQVSRGRGAKKQQLCKHTVFTTNPQTVSDRDAHPVLDPEPFIKP